MGYDKLNRLIDVTDWLGHTTHYDYDAAGRLTQTTNANGTIVSYGYDAASRLNTLSNQKSDTTVINSYAYTLDAVGNPVQEARDEPLQPSLPSGDMTNSYDGENRLTQSNGITNSFDANGNLIQKGSNTYTYDYENRLVQTHIGGITTSYQYDGTGNRYARTEAGATTRFVLDTNTSLTNVLAETDASGVIQAYNVYGHGLISRILPDGTTATYHYDSRGSTIALTDTSEAVTDSSAEAQATQTWNRYAYALNNPVRLIDVSGFSAKEGQVMFGVKGASDTQNQYLVDSAVAGSTSMSRNEGAVMIADELKQLGSIAAKKFATKLSTATVRGAVFAWNQGYKTVGEWLGSVQGAVVQTTGGARVNPILACIVADYISTKVLDAIEGKANTVPVLSRIPIVGKILFRYHVAGEEVDEFGNVFYDGEFLSNLNDPAAEAPVGWSGER